MNKFFNKNYFLLSVVSTVILFLSFNYIVQKINFNLGIDFTSNKTFTLSNGTKRVIDEIDEPIKINFVYSRNLSKNIPIIQKLCKSSTGIVK